MAKQFHQCQYFRGRHHCSSGLGVGSLAHFVSTPCLEPSIKKWTIKLSNHHVPNLFHDTTACLYLDPPIMTQTTRPAKQPDFDVRMKFAIATSWHANGRSICTQNYGISSLQQLLRGVCRSVASPQQLLRAPPASKESPQSKSSSLGSSYGGLTRYDGRPKFVPQKDNVSSRNKPLCRHQTIALSMFHVRGTSDKNGTGPRTNEPPYFFGASSTAPHVPMRFCCKNFGPSRKTRRTPITGSTMKMLFKTTQVEWCQLCQQKKGSRNQGCHKQF